MRHKWVNLIDMEKYFTVCFVLYLFPQESGIWWDGSVGGYNIKKIKYIIKKNKI